MSYIPGPWTADFIDEYGWILDAEGNYLAELVHEDEESRFIKNFQTRVANAQLMAAAPELLTVLTTLIVKMKNAGMNSHHWKKDIESADKAIKKARFG